MRFEVLESLLHECASTMPPKKALSAFFCFRRAITGALQAEFPGSSVGVLGKITGERWKALGEEERKIYEDEASKDKERFARENAEFSAQHAEPPVKSSAAEDDLNSTALLLPPSRIKRLAKLDPEVGTVSKDATFALTLATELFIGALAADAGDVAKATKRKTIGDSDLLRVIHSDDSLSFLRLDFPQTTPSSGPPSHTAATAAGVSDATGPRKRGRVKPLLMRASTTSAVGAEDTAAAVGDVVEQAAPQASKSSSGTIGKAGGALDVMFARAAAEAALRPTRAVTHQSPRRLSGEDEEGWMETGDASEEVVQAGNRKRQGREQARTAAGATAAPASSSATTSGKKRGRANVGGAAAPGAMNAFVRKVSAEEAAAAAAAAFRALRDGEAAGHMSTGTHRHITRTDDDDDEGGNIAAIRARLGSRGTGRRAVIPQRRQSHRADVRSTVAELLDSDDEGELQLGQESSGDA